MKTIVIYHSADLDGFCSGAVGKLRYPDAELIGYDYNKPFPWERIPLDDCQVFMIDVSMSMTDMARLRDITHGRFTWIDHHISAINDYNEKTAADGKPVCMAYIKNGKAACELAWEYFFPDDEMPEGVLTLGQYDTWRNEDKELWDRVILPFQYGCRTMFETPELICDVLRAGEFGKNQVSRIAAAGKVILNYQKQQNKIQCSAAFEQVFEGLRAVCLNCGGFNSLVFDSVYDPAKHDVMLMFRFDGTGWRISLYADKPEVDCSVIAKKYGGGGHRGAAGFRIQGDVCPFSGPKVEKKA